MRTILFFTILISLTLACGSGSTNDAPEIKASAKNDKKTSCLADIANDPCSLMSLAEVAAISGMAESDIEKEEPHEVLKNPAYMNCSFSWPSDRTKTMEILGTSRELPVDNNIQFGSINVITQEELDRYGQERIEYFEKRYRNMTEEEKEKAKAMMKEKLDENEELDETQKKVGSSLLDMASNFRFQPIEGIGEMASWETNKNDTAGTLIILHYNVIFRVSVNISSESAENLEVAKKVASKILERCS